MSVFAKELAKRQPKKSNRQWLFVPYDQLSDKIGPLAGETPKSLGIVLVETPACIGPSWNDTAAPCNTTPG